MQKKVRVSSVKSFDINSDNALAGWSTEEKAIIDNVTLKTLFTSEDWVFICVDLIAQEISNVPLFVMRKVQNNGKTTYEYADNHPVQKLLENPNRYQGQSDFTYCLTTEYTLMGNAICWNAKANNELYVIPTEQAMIEFNSDNTIKDYLYNPDVNNGFTKQSSVKLPVESIMHIRRPNPNSVLWGLSPFIPGRKTVLFNRYSTDYLLAFYQKGATPQIALSMDKNASVESVTRMLRSFEAAYSGRKNARRTMLLPKGVTAQPFNISIADQKLLDIINMNREVIINILRIPKHALSLQSTGSLGSEEHKQSLRYFWSATIMPTMQKIEDSLNKFFAKELGQDFEIQFDTVNVSILKDDELKTAQIAKEMLLTHTVNEVRSKLYELAPLPGGDTTPSAPSQNTGLPVTLGNVAVQSHPMNNQNDIIGQPSSIPENDENEIAENLKFTRKLFAKHKDYLKGHTDSISSFEKEKQSKIVKLMLSIFGQQMDLALEEVSRELNRIDYMPGKSFKAKYSPKRLRMEIMDAFDSLKDQYTEEATAQLYEGVELGFNQNMGLIFNQENRDAIEVLRVENQAKQRAILQARALDTFAKISETTTNRIVDTVANGMENKLTLQDIAKNIAQDFRQISPSRAMTIARTEALTAVSMGQAAMMQHAKKVLPDLVKVWINAEDERVRGNPGGLYPDAKFDHWEMQGKRAQVDEVFEPVGLRYPRDPRGEAGNVINCRCSFVVLSKEDIESIQNLPEE